MATATKKPTSKKSFSLISDTTFLRMYEAMLGSRLLEERSRRELRSRRSKKHPLAEPAQPALGQEAVVIGTTLELRPDDTITAPGSEVIFRTPAKRAKGKAAQAEQALAEARRNVIAFTASHGAPLTIGAGIALANKDYGTQRVVVAFGDADPASLGAWNEALRLAGLHQLPILFVLRPGEGSAVTATIRELAERAGVITIPVDAADVVAMYRVSFESIARARKGTGATLIVATPYALEGETAETADPIARMESYLAKKELFSAKIKADALRRLKQKT